MKIFAQGKIIIILANQTYFFKNKFYLKYVKNKVDNNKDG